MLNVRLDVTLTLAGPLMTRSTAAGAYGIDAPMARDMRERLCLAGTLVKGRLRDAWTELRSAAGDIFAVDIDALLGHKSGSAENPGPVEPLRGRLRFEDFVCEAPQHDGALFRIAIDEQRGSVKHGAHQVIEAPFGSGARVSFHGAIRFSAIDQNELDTVQRQVTTGLRWITTLGAMRTVGFGRLLDVSVAATAEPVASVVTRASGTERLAMLLTLDGPFCVPRHHADDNLFESDIAIPGGVLKGSLATTWQAQLGQPLGAPVTTSTDPARPKLGEHFARLRFTHAFPVRVAAGEPQRGRPVVPPLSVVKLGKMVFDVALESDAVLIDGQAPAFEADWKDASDVRARFGWPEPARELRVRTAIDATTRRGAEGQLFAYEMVVPRSRERAASEPDDIVWSARVDLGGVPAADREQVESDLRQVLARGLHGIGKTKTNARVEWLVAEHDRDYIQCQATNAGPWILTLQTPALLCASDGLSESSDERELHERYEQAFAALSEGSLRLVRYMARQRLAGGYYVWRRFLDTTPYRPYLLTEPGSVFVLEPMRAHLATAALAHVDDWLRHGLPLPPWAAGVTWQTCPYVPENGYGEVAVNLETHWADRPVGRTRSVAVLGGA